MQPRKAMPNTTATMNGVVRHQGGRISKENLLSLDVFPVLESSASAWNE